jgi:hypothetical protein
MRILPVLLAAALLLPAACNRAGPPPSEDEIRNARALADVDMAATDALRTDLLTRFGMAPDQVTVEAALTGTGFTCEPDPTDTRERACIRERPRDACIEATIVRTQPWSPREAQVIVICETAHGGAGAASSP